MAAAEVEASRRGTRRIDPYVAEWFGAGEIPDIHGLAKELGALGLLGMHLDGYGCAGMSATDYGLTCLELEASDSGVCSLVSAQGAGLAGQVRHLAMGQRGAEAGVAVADGHRLGRDNVIGVLPLRSVDRRWS